MIEVDRLNKDVLKILRDEPGHIAYDFRGTGKTTTLFYFIREYYDGNAIVVVPSSRMRHWMLTFWREYFQAGFMPTFTHNVEKLRGQRLPIFVDEESALTFEDREMLRSLPTFKGGVASC